jgi:hypothetical protein
MITNAALPRREGQSGLPTEVHGDGRANLRDTERGNNRDNEDQYGLLICSHGPVYCEPRTTSTPPSVGTRSPEKECLQIEGRREVIQMQGTPDGNHHEGKNDRKQGEADKFAHDSYIVKPGSLNNNRPPAQNLAVAAPVDDPGGKRG